PRGSPIVYPIPQAATAQSAPMPFSTMFSAPLTEAPLGAVAPQAYPVTVESELVVAVVVTGVSAPVPPDPNAARALPSLEWMAILCSTTPPPLSVQVSSMKNGPFVRTLAVFPGG